MKNPKKRIPKKNLSIITQETEAGKFSDSVTQEMPSQAESIKKALLEIEAKEVNTETVKRKMTRAQAEVTPEARKVRQAKAKAAYAMNQARLIEGASPSIDIKNRTSLPARICIKKKRLQTIVILQYIVVIRCARACLKIHFCHLHATSDGKQFSNTL